MEELIVCDGSGRSLKSVSPSHITLAVEMCWGGAGQRSQGAESVRHSGRVGVHMQGEELARGRKACQRHFPPISVSRGGQVGGNRALLSWGFHEAFSKGLDLWARTHMCARHSYLRSHLPWHIKYAWLYFMKLEEAKVTQLAAGRADTSRRQGQYDEVSALRAPCGLSGKQQALSTCSIPGPHPISHLHKAQRSLPRPYPYHCSLGTVWPPLLAPLQPE